MPMASADYYKGFTLIELMIVITIIGVLTSIALPQYHQYIEKAQISSAMTSLAAHKMNIEAYLISEGQFPNSNSQLNLPYSSLGTLTYQNTPESYGSLVFTFNSSKVSARLIDKEITFTRLINGNWECISDLDSFINTYECD